MSKIAIPSKDKVNIAEEFALAPFFLIFEIGNGVINNHEIRKNPISPETETSSQEINSIVYNFLCDCNIIMCRKISKDLSDSFKESGIQVMKTLEMSARKGIINTICR
jgi:predicted Fe-Mo cluster-binding NifX family protein